MPFVHEVDIDETANPELCHTFMLEGVLPWTQLPAFNNVDNQFVLYKVQSCLLPTLKVVSEVEGLLSTYTKAFVQSLKKVK